MDPKPSPYPVHRRAGSLTMELYASPVDSLLSPHTRRRGSPSYDKFAWQPGGLLTRVIGYTTIHIYIGESQGDGRGARVNIRKCCWSMEARTSATLRDAKMKFEMNSFEKRVLYYVRYSFLLGIVVRSTSRSQHSQILFDSCLTFLIISRNEMMLAKR